MTDEATASGESESPDEDYDVNFFNPRTPLAKSNMRLICVLVCIWVVTIFGFQAALLILEKPTPEPAYDQYESVKAKVTAGTASPDEQRTYARSCLMVLGKNIVVKAPDKALLSEAVAVSVMKLLPEERQAELPQLLVLEEHRYKKDKEAKEETVVQRVPPENLDKAVALVTETIGLETTGFDKLMADLLPSTLKMVAAQETPATVATALAPLDKVMAKYLIHNRSVLTDTTFIGFPFHYWYTAQFLLILFVGLCLAYAVLIDKAHKKHGFVEE